MPNPVVFRTHFWSTFIASQFYQLESQLGPDRVYLLFDDTHNPLPTIFTFSRLSSPATIPGNRFFAMNESESRSVNPLHVSNKETIESSIVILDRLISEPFDFLWLVEYDVYCDGDWHQVLSRVDDTDFESGFLATKVADYDPHLFWNHWFSLTGRRLSKPPLFMRVKSFFPLVRLSKTFIEIIRQNLGIYSGFCEIYLPTLARQKQVPYGNLPDDLLGDMFEYHYEKKELTLQKTHHNHKLYHPILISPDRVRST